MTITKVRSFGLVSLETGRSNGGTRQPSTRTSLRENDGKDPSAAAALPILPACLANAALRVFRYTNPITCDAMPGPWAPVDREPNFGLRENRQRPAPAQSGGTLAGPAL